MKRPSRLSVAWAFLVFALAIRAFAGGVLPSRGGTTVSPLRLDPNRASVAELLVLPGIGPERAEAIVLDRIRNGPFRSPEDLLRVHGIGPERIAAVRRHLRFDAPARPSPGR